MCKLRIRTRTTSTRLFYKTLAEKRYLLQYGAEAEGVEKGEVAGVGEARSEHAMVDHGEIERRDEGLILAAVASGCSGGGGGGGVRKRIGRRHRVRLRADHLLLFLIHSSLVII